MTVSKAKQKRARRERAHARIRQRVTGTAERPRMSVFKSAKYIYVQLIDDQSGKTLAQASTRETALQKQSEGSAKTKSAARAIGEAVAERAKATGIEQVVFDRGGYQFHGRVKEIAEGARSKGLQF